MWVTERYDFANWQLMDGTAAGKGTFQLQSSNRHLGESKKGKVRPCTGRGPVQAVRPIVGVEV